MSGWRECPICNSANVGQENDGLRMWIECFDCHTAGAPVSPVDDSAEASDAAFAAAEDAWNRRTAAPVPTREDVLTAIAQNITSSAYESVDGIGSYIDAASLEDAADAVMNLRGWA